MKADKLEFSLGETKHKQPLRLVYERREGTFTIYRDEADQRDDRVFIAGIPGAALVKAAEAAASV